MNNSPIHGWRSVKDARGFSIPGYNTLSGLDKLLGGGDKADATVSPNLSTELSNGWKTDPGKAEDMAIYTDPVDLSLNNSPIHGWRSVKDARGFSIPGYNTLSGLDKLLGGGDK